MDTGVDCARTQYIRTHDDMAFLMRQPDSSLALVRNLWVNVRSQHLPALLARTPHVERLALSITAARRYGNPRGLALSAALRLREFEFVTPEPSYMPDTDVFFRALGHPAFRLSHMRLGYIDSHNGYWAAQFFCTHGAALVDLTHLAFDACRVLTTRMSVYSVLEASARLPALRVFAVAVPAGGKDAQAYADLLLTLRFPQFVVMLDPPSHSRARDWKAQSDGKRGFW